MHDSFLKGSTPQSTYILYIEYRAVSGVFRTIDPHPLSTQRVCLPPHQWRGIHSRRAVRGWVNVSEDARYWIGLLQYNPSTDSTLSHPRLAPGTCNNGPPEAEI